MGSGAISDHCVMVALKAPLTPYTVADAYWRYDSGFPQDSEIEELAWAADVKVLAFLRDLGGLAEG